MIEIFKTKVKSKRLANKVLKALQSSLPGCCFNFDLDDCNRMLRDQSGGPAEIEKITQMVQEHGVEISLLKD